MFHCVSRTYLCRGRSSDRPIRTYSYSRILLGKPRVQKKSKPNIMSAFCVKQKFQKYTESLTFAWHLFTGIVFRYHPTQVALIDRMQTCTISLLQTSWRKGCTNYEFLNCRRLWSPLGECAGIRAANLISFARKFFPLILSCSAVKTKQGHF